MVGFAPTPSPSLTSIVSSVCCYLCNINYYTEKGTCKHLINFHEYFWIKMKISLGFTIFITKLVIYRTPSCINFTLTEQPGRQIQFQYASATKWLASAPDWYLIYLYTCQLSSFISLIKSPIHCYYYLRNRCGNITRTFYGSVVTSCLLSVFFNTLDSFYAEPLSVLELLRS